MNASDYRSGAGGSSSLGPCGVPEAYRGPVPGPGSTSPADDTRDQQELKHLPGAQAHPSKRPDPFPGPPLACLKALGLLPLAGAAEQPHDT